VGSWVRLPPTCAEPSPGSEGRGAAAFLRDSRGARARGTRLRAGPGLGTGCCGCA